MGLSDKLQGIHFFQFSEGSYSDYQVGGAYACDHEVKQEEWAAHYGAFVATRQAKQEEMVTARYENLEVYRIQWKKFREWCEAQPNPETTFVEKHNMVAIEVTECWRD
jgi:hypothetical protein